MVSCSMGVRILTVQYDVVSIASRDAWISMLIGSLLSFAAGIGIIYPLARLNPESDFPQMLIKLFGKIPGRIFLIFMTIFSASYTGFTLRIFVQAIKNFLLDRTPTEVLVGVIALTVILTVKRGVDVIGASVDLTFPLITASLVVLFFLSLSEVRLLEFQPVLYKNSINVIKGTLPAFGSVLGQSTSAYYLCYVKDQKKARKWIVFGGIIVIFLYTELTMVTIGAFGPEEIKTMMYPTLILSKAIEFPVTLFERLEILFTIAWIPGIFAWMLLFSFASVRNFTELLGIKQRYQKYVAFAHIPLLLTIALIPRNALEVFEYLRAVEMLGIIFVLVVAPVMLVISLFRRRKGAKC
jgi:spore germination protein